MSEVTFSGSYKFNLSNSSLIDQSNESKAAFRDTLPFETTGRRQNVALVVSAQPDLALVRYLCEGSVACLKPKGYTQQNMRTFQQRIGNFRLLTCSDHTICTSLQDGFCTWVPLPAIATYRRSWELVDLESYPLNYALEAVLDLFTIGILRTRLVASYTPPPCNSQKRFLAKGQRLRA